MCHPNAYGYLTSESDANNRGKNWHVSHVDMVDDSLCVGAPISGFVLCLFLSRGTISSGSGMIMMEHPSPWPLWVTVVPLQGSLLRGLQELCTRCVWQIGISP